MKCNDVIQFVGPYLDSELDTTTTFQIQAHLAQCPSCNARYAQEHDLESRISHSLQGVHGPDDDARWMQILDRALPQKAVAIRKQVPLWIHMGSISSHWISLVASLVFLAALASAGLGLRHGGHHALPTDGKFKGHGGIHVNQASGSLSDATIPQDHPGHERLCRA